MKKPRPRAALWTCRKCKRYWTGTTQAHCSACCEHFSCVTLFDLHRRGRGDERGCVDPSTLANHDGFPTAVRRATAHGPMWVRNDSRLHPNARQK
jgi:hypothetical protein